MGGRVLGQPILGAGLLVRDGRCPGDHCRTWQSRSVPCPASRSGCLSRRAVPSPNERGRPSSAHRLGHGALRDDRKASAQESARLGSASWRATLRATDRQVEAGAQGQTSRGALPGNGNGGRAAGLFGLGHSFRWTGGEQFGISAVDGVLRHDQARRPLGRATGTGG